MRANSTIHVFRKHKNQKLWADIRPKSEPPRDSKGQPRPVILVGKNGSGKSIVLSHIVNGLLLAKDLAYPDSTEVSLGKVYKLRSSLYVTNEREYCFSSAQFESGIFCRELVLTRQKRHFGTAIPIPPDETGWPGPLAMWNNMDDTDSSCIKHNTAESHKNVIKDLYSERCVLYFPPERFEDPAWLNKDNLDYRPSLKLPRRVEGFTDRAIIRHAPFRDIQDWIFALIYDWAVSGQQKVQGIYATILNVFQGIVGPGRDIRPIIRHRHSRLFSIFSEKEVLVPSAFQLSSGELSLLSMFLSIVMDYDMTKTSLNNPKDIRGIVIVDEIDLHLHASYQYEVLPRLIRMFPNVQFVVTTHSPLFVLGLSRELGDGGFALYDLPNGRAIAPEEFGEFGAAYAAYANTRTHLGEIEAAVRETQKPILFVEGKTDKKYLIKAAGLLDFETTILQFDIRIANGKPNLNKIWNHLTRYGIEREKLIVTLRDIEDSPTKSAPDREEGTLIRRTIERVEANPVRKGIENLFSTETLRRAIEHNSAFIDIIGKHTTTEGGVESVVEEEWIVADSRKTELCNWLCDNGNPNDFDNFRPTLELLRDLLGDQH